MPHIETDLELIEAVLEGDTKKYAILVKRHQKLVFSLALRYVKKREDAEEIAQDCFVKAYKALGTFKKTAKFSTWLYTITYTTAMTFLRRQRLDTQPIEADEAYIQIANPDSSFDSNLIERKNISILLEESIQALLPDDAAILTLFYKAEQSLEEIGSSLGMHANTVKVKLHRARKRLKERLKMVLGDEVEDLI
ncbi:RNA polymerase sigma factor [Pedobacter montanisoli]|uniref:Sigma-70 family RNA polymerase sigma factor n=1 Tax=Pedobacter montanisoli TaxID=2923277 RepID=A0ABS9ZTW7_9SPHI|nr:sigma-70 family RNA polymerase sigma factor [Pedobacter montanisoli]MCJ0741807.1 sigma-70 family RNA polymerase sigma factor [Pedobacter montanisoli]